MLPINLKQRLIALCTHIYHCYVSPLSVVLFSMSRYKIIFDKLSVFLLAALMKRSTIWMLWFCYFASQLMGLLTFHYDYRSGEVYTSKLLTMYSAVLGIVMLAVLPLTLQLDFDFKNVRAPDLHLRISAIFFVFNVVVILTLILLNWTRRQCFMQTLRDFEGMRRSFLLKWPLSPAVAEKWENEFRTKFLWGCLSGVLIVMGANGYFTVLFRRQNIWVYLPLTLFLQIFSVSMFHYYFLLLNINTIQLAINEELENILKISRNHSLSGTLGDTRNWVRDLDLLAVTQYSVQGIVKRINRMYDLQMICVIFTVSLDFLTLIYMSYMSWYHPKVRDYYSAWTKIALVLGILFYNVDVKNCTICMFRVQDYAERTGYLLKQREENEAPLERGLEEGVSVELKRNWPKDYLRILYCRGVFYLQENGLLEYMSSI